MRYYLTFGQQYRHEPHPIVGGLAAGGVHPDGYVTIHADSETEARHLATKHFGRWWSGLYRDELKPELFPLGELFVIGEEREHEQLEPAFAPPGGCDPSSLPERWQAGVETAVCFIEGCEYSDIDPRGPVFIRGSDTPHYACTAHWESIIGIVGIQVTMAQGDAMRWSPDEAI